MTRQFEKTNLPGVTLISLKRHTDHRGSFVRLFDVDLKIDIALAQTALSFNPIKHTLRGMHLQRSPHAEAKLVYCTRGRLHDVVVDLRPQSPTYCRWYSIELCAEDSQLLLVPPGCAHGFLTLENDTELLYHISERYMPECEMGVAWNDPVFGIEWPFVPAVISERDQNHPPFEVASCASS